MVDANMSYAEVEEQFRKWLSDIHLASGIRRFTDTAIFSFCHSLRRTCRKIEPFAVGNMFQVISESEFDNVYAKIINSANFEELDNDSNGAFLAALKLYQAFLHDDETAAEAVPVPLYFKISQAPTDIPQEDFYSTTRREIALHGDTAISNDPDETEEEPQEVYRYTEVPMTPVQKIYYGAPGTGKSYSVNQMLTELYPIPSEKDSHCRRTIFHPTYTYEDFVGSIRPLTTPDRPLDYVFTAGPFTILLKEAFLHPYETFYLIIEEINRGNAPAIFGDLFQLLDRQPGGRSAYAIQSTNLVTYLSRDPGLKNLFIDGKIWLPANFNIIATMNTADENIFVLDNAFKRRFALEYVPIHFDDVPDDWSACYDIFQGAQPLVMLFRNTPLEEYAEKLDKEGRLVRNWPTFARLTNKLIDWMNKQSIHAGNIHLARIPENKKLGVFFAGKDDLISRDAFINKVIFYLKQDVFTSSDHYLTDSFEEIYDRYKNGKYDVFELLR